MGASACEIPWSYEREHSQRRWPVEAKRGGLEAPGGTEIVFGFAGFTFWGMAAASLSRASSPFHKPVLSLETKPSA